MNATRSIIERLKKTRSFGRTGVEIDCIPTRPALWALESRCTPTAVTWDGGAATLNWNDANNWNPDGVPGVGDDVTVNAAGTVTISFGGGASTINSLKLSDSLTVSGGNFNVASGLTMDPALWLSGKGPGVSVLVSGQSNIGGANLSASSGAKIALPGLTVFDALLHNQAFHCDGTGSELDLSSLKSLTVSTPDYDEIDVKASNGGHIKLNSLNSINNRVIAQFRADGINSAIDIPLLQSYTGDTGFNWQLKASNGGAVHTPSLTVIDYADLYVDALSSLDTAQIKQLCYGYLTVSAAKITFPALSSLDESSVVALAGANLSFPLVTSFAVEDQGPPPCEFRAEGPGSVLDLSNCKSYGGSTYTFAFIRAFNGGHVILNNVASMDPSDGQQIVADGAGSVIDLSSLVAYASDGKFIWTMTASNNGVIQLPSAGSVLITNAVVTSTTGGSITAGMLNLGKGSFLDGNSQVGSVTGMGTIRPGGVGTGTLTVAGNLALTSGASLQTQINGATSGNYDSLAVNGTVNLSGASLTATVGYSPVVGATFKIIENDGSEPVLGTFNGMPPGTTAATTSNGLFMLVNYAGGDGNDVTLRAHPIRVQIENGATQRSVVRTLTVNFNEAVTLGANSFSLSGPSGITVNANLDMTGKIATLTFSGAPVIGGSLPDGKYTLSVNGSAITVQSTGLALDADADGIPGGSQPFEFHRLFGDADGDATVAANDFIQFRLALGGNSVTFDFDGDGSVSASDFIQFRLRFGGSI